MKQLKEILLGMFVIIVAAFLVVFIYRQESLSKNRALAKQILELSPRGGPPETIDGLRQAIALYEAQIERNVQEAAQTGVYWKILATRLADKNLHNDALAALDRAIYYNTDDPILFHLTGVSAGNVAKSIIGFSANAENERAHYFKLAENGYLRALELDDTYTKPMYGIAILYAFELNRPAEAIPYLERYLKIQASDISAMFVLARAYVMIENHSQAIEIYERIINRTKDRKIKEEALNNIDIIQRYLYG